LTEQCAPIEAVQQELRCFTDLLDERPILGTDRQLGLLGELLFLERLMKRIGPAALDAWLGPLGEPHDFRVWINEFEVKTTIAPHRIHTVNGLEQLVASHGCTLYLVSVLLGPAGAEGGFSLADKVSQLSSSFSALPDRKEAFTAALDACGLHMADVQHYTRRFALRRPFGVATVDQSFPALSRPLIQRAIGPLATRIEGVHYEVNIEGLESEDGTPAFEAAFT
jgi:hypothetical protein